MQECPRPLQEKKIDKGSLGNLSVFNLEPFGFEPFGFELKVERLKVERLNAERLNAKGPMVCPFDCDVSTSPSAVSSGPNCSCRVAQPKSSPLYVNPVNG